MSEKTMRRHVVRKLREWDAVSVENPAHPGTPDVNCTLGWLELKWLPRWPRNALSSPVLLPHYTKEQRVWIERRWRARGTVGLLLKVGACWLLYNGMAAQRVGRLTRAELLDYADCSWVKWNTKGIVQCLEQWSRHLRSD